MEDESWKRNHVGGEIVEEESWRKHGGRVMEE